MSTFVLILTLLANGGTAMTSVPGFESEGACTAAGQVWMQESINAHLGGRFSFVCVGQGGK